MHCIMSSGELLFWIFPCAQCISTAGARVCKTETWQLSNSLHAKGLCMLFATHDLLESLQNSMCKVALLKVPVCIKT